MASEHGNDGLDLGVILDEHVRAEFELRGADVAVTTMTDDHVDPSLFVTEDAGSKPAGSIRPDSLADSITSTASG
jgi:hypothetical protein